MGHGDPPIRHHDHKVPQAQLEARVPAHAPNDDLSVEVPSFEQIFDRDAPLHLFIIARHPRLCTRAQYLNNIIEQDHRAIKRRVNAKQGFREFQAARQTIQGYEAMHIIRKGQVRWLSGSGVRRQNRFINELFEVA